MSWAIGLSDADISTQTLAYTVTTGYESRLTIEFTNRSTSVTATASLWVVPVGESVGTEHIKESGTTLGLAGTRQAVLIRKVIAPAGARVYVQASNANVSCQLSGDITSPDNTASALTTALSAYSTSAVVAASGGSALVGFLQSGTGAVSRTVQSKERDIVSVFDFMTTAQIVDVQSGSTPTLDLRTIFATAAVAVRGKKLNFPKGNYLFNTDNGSVTLEEICFEGEFVLDGATATIDQGAVFWITGTTNAPFLVRRGTEFRGLGFYYPNQVDSPTPAAYPPMLDFDFTGSGAAVQFVYVDSCVVYNAYRFCRIDNAGGAVGHVWFTNNTIYGISTCFELTYNAEVIKIIGNTFTFGHFLAATESGLRAYTRANGIIFQAAKSDGIFFTDNLCFGYLDALKLASTGLVLLCRISNNSFDQVRYGIHATGTGNFTSSQITGNDFYCLNAQNTALQANGIRIDTSGAIDTEALDITGNTFALTTEDAIFISGNAATRKHNISSNTFRLWAAYKAAGSYGGINVSGSLTSAALNNNTFYAAGAYAAYTAGVKGSLNTLQVIGNTFESCQDPISITTNIYTQVGNTAYSTGGTVTDTISATTCWSVGNNYDKPSATTTRCAFTVRKNAAQTTAGTTPLTVTFATTTFDKGTNFSSPTFTAPKKGRYSFNWSLLHDNTGTAADRFSINLTTGAGVVCSTSYKMIADYNTVSGSGQFEMVLGDTLTLIITRVGGTGVFNTFNDATANYLTGKLVE